MRCRPPSPSSAAPWLLAGALLLIVAAAAALWMRRAAASQTPVESLRFSFLAMGTVGEIAVSGAPADLAAAAADAAEARIASLEADYSAFRPDSLVSRLNRGERVPLPDDGKALFRLAFRVAEASGGAFDPTVGPLLRAWGLRGGTAPASPPDAAALSNALARVGWRRVRLVPGSPESEAQSPKSGVQSPNSGDFRGSSGELFVQCDDGVELDFGGVAKGLAVDRAYDAALSALAEGGCPDAGLLVNLGGNIRARGRPRSGADGWTVAIRDPFQPLGRGSVGTLLLTNGLATATSGSYERFIEIGGERFSHIIDPRTGYPVRGVAQATVLAPTAAEADALSTAFFVLGTDAPKTLFDAFPAAEVRFVFEPAAPADAPLRIAFTEDTGVIRNPGQGWTAARWTFDQADPLVNIGAFYARFEWCDLEPEDGVYNWTKLDALLDMALSQGLPASFRIMCVSAPNSHTGWTSPKWVFDKGAKDEPFVTPVDIGGRKVEVVQHAPVFDDPVFMEEHRRFLEALAARYDGDPRLWGLDIGSYGNWGEWHCHGLPPNTNRYFEATAKLPFVAPKVYPADIRRQYADWYLEGFRKSTLVFMTDDWETFKFALGDGAVPRVGMRRDGVGSPHHFERWIGTPPYDAVPRMADVWRDRPVWFEFFCPAGQFKDKGWSIERSVEWMLTNHVSTVNTIPFAPWEIGDGPEIFPLLRKIDLYAGARLVPREAEVRRLGRRTVSVRLAGENIGVARIHLPYALQIVVAGPDGGERLVHEASVDPGTWLPGPFAAEESFTVPAEADLSGARLSLRLRHRGGVFRDFRFAALETADDGSLPLGGLPVSEPQSSGSELRH